MICAGNWKLNKSPKEAKEFLAELVNSTKELDQSQFIVFPPVVSLESASSVLTDSKINLGCQHISLQESGAFTGETSITHIKELNCNYVLIGHSERRTLYNETNADISAKVKLSLNKGLKPMICIGETLFEREAGKTFAVLDEQLKMALAHVTASDNVAIAYEPVWAIGTGKVAGPTQVDEVHNFLRNKIKDRFNEDYANSTALLYGGSVTPESASDLSKVKNVDGFLIGGASLKVDSFIDIYKNSK